MGSLTKTHAGAAVAAPDTLTPKIQRSVLSVENLASGITAFSLPCGAVPELLGAGKRLFDRVKESDMGRPHVDGWIVEELFARQAQLAVLLDRQQVIGIAHYHKTGPDAVTIRGLAVDPRYGRMKLGTVLPAIAVAHAPLVFDEVRRFECSLRVLGHAANERSRASFERIGFVLEEPVGISYLDGSHHNRDKMPTAEIDGHGAFIRYQRMTSTDETSSRAARFLQDWASDILPFPAAAS